MKNSFTAFMCLTLATLPLVIHGQDVSWEQRSDMPAPRWGAGTFVIGGIAYVVGGSSVAMDHAEMWAYDPITNTWTSKASIPGVRKQPFAFSVNGKGYVGCGIVGTSNFLSDVWEYDPIADSWTAKATFPGGARYNTWQFVINGMAYVGGGNSAGAGGPFHSDAYIYDATSDTWSTGVPIPDQGRHGAVGFSISNKGYVICGRENSLAFVQDMWSFDPITQAWNVLAAFPGAPRSSPLVFAYNNDVIVGCGRDGSTNYYDAWLYRPWNNTWTPMLDYPGATAMAGSSFSVLGRAFGGLGWDLATNTSHSDLWELVKFDDVGIRDAEALSGSITVFPNPSSSNSSIQFTTTITDRINLRIFDVEGSCVGEIEFSMSVRFPIVDLAAGHYTAVWTTDDLHGIVPFIISKE